MAALWRVLATLLASLAVRLCVYVLDQGPMPGQPKKRKSSCSCSCYRLKPNRVSVWSWVTHGNAYEWRGAWFDCHYFGVHRNVYRHRFFHHRHGASLRAVSGQQCEHRVSDDDLAEFDLDHRQRTKAVT